VEWDEAGVQGLATVLGQACPGDGDGTAHHIIEHGLITTIIHMPIIMQQCLTAGHIIHTITRMEQDGSHKPTHHLERPLQHKCLGELLPVVKHLKTNTDTFRRGLRK